MKKTATELIKTWIDLIDRRYNPENDTILNAPELTHTDMLLASMISGLAEKIDSMEASKPQPQVEAIQAAYN